MECPNLSDMLLQLRKLKGDPEKLDAALHAFVSTLIDPRNLGAGKRTRTLSILTTLADRWPSSFGFGEPSKAGPVVLALLGTLPVASEAEQQLVDAALWSVLRLLRASSARAYALVAREAVELLSSLPAASGPIAAALTGFVHFAQLCGTPSTPGVTFRLETACRVEWLRTSALKLAAEMHADVPQCFGAGTPGLWTALLHQLECAPFPPSPSAPPAFRVALGGLSSLLTQAAAPRDLHSKLLDLLLARLCAALPEDLPQHKSPPPRNSLLGSECDDLLGACLDRLSQPALPYLPKLLRATPWVLATSSSVQLHGAFGRILRSLPPSLLAHHVSALEPFLGCKDAQRPVIECYERAFEPAATDKENAGPLLKRQRLLALVESPSGEAALHTLRAVVTIRLRATRDHSARLAPALRDKARRTPPPRDLAPRDRQISARDSDRDLPLAGRSAATDGRARRWASICAT